MQALKALVILMGVLIVAGMGLLAYGLITRGGPSDGAGGAFEALDLPMPEGCSIAGTELAGERLVLRFDGLAERDCQQVVIIDLAGGRVLGRVKAVSEPAR